MTPADSIEAVIKELRAMRELDMIDDRQLVKALTWVANNQAQVADMAVYSSISDIADTVRDIAAGACSTTGSCK